MLQSHKSLPRREGAASQQHLAITQDNYFSEKTEESSGPIKVVRPF